MSPKNKKQLNILRKKLIIDNKLLKHKGKVQDCSKCFIFEKKKK